MLIAIAAAVIGAWVVALLLTNGNPITPVASHRPACEMLGVSDIETALGVAALDGREGDSGPAGCFWALPSLGGYDDRLGQFIGVRMDFIGLDDYTAYEAEIGHPSGRQMVRRIMVDKHDGLLISLDQQRTLLARQGRDFLSLYVSVSTTGTYNVRAELQLMKLALTRVGE